ncbi:S8 family peptidase [Aestuariispira ectoiniformans]|uniref:S8 family peptidase n=1 Tax=Aestuariispira ectoiniformans TaxID=2775080 RepID=UPI00223C06F5|nr:S8 family serine peptidase [Aestuariispira ectoiniformans]
MSKFTSIFAAIVLAVAPGLAFGDDFDALMSQASGGDTVDVLITSWQPVTGEINPEDLDSVVTGAIDVEAEHRALMRQIEAAGGKASVLRDYKHLRVNSLRVDAKALKAAKAFGGGQNVYADELKVISLKDTAGFVGATDYWTKGRRGTGQVVAVLDTGIDTSHPFLAGKVMREACFSMTNCPNGETEMIGPGAARPVHFHGTHVAGIIAGENGKFSGMAPGAKIIGINVFSKSGDKMGARDRDIIAGLDYLLGLMIDDGIEIAAVNMSLGGGPYYKSPCNDSIYEVASRLFLSRGSALVIASGNEGHKNGLPSPACAGSAFSVGAIDKHGAVAAFSNSASYLDILAPGVGIVSSVSIPGKTGYMELDGTSMAAPHVTGAVALMREAYPRMNINQLLQRLKSREVITDPANGVAVSRLQLKHASDAVVEKPEPEIVEDAPKPPVAEKTEPPKKPVPAKPEPMKKKQPKPTGVISIGGDTLPGDGDGAIGGDSGTTAITQ